jgi:hypothetical protein
MTVAFEVLRKRTEGCIADAVILKIDLLVLHIMPNTPKKSGSGEEPLGRERSEEGKRSLLES